MNGQRLFLDTFFVQALLNRLDQHHPSAKSRASLLRSAGEVFVTEAVIVEIGDALSAFDREGAARFIEQLFRTPNVRIISVDRILLQRALQLYRDHKDKTWGLTDCISFIVMRDHALSDALTGDKHFVQAGFRTLLE